MSIVPIKKCIILFYVYITTLFGKVPGLEQGVKYIKLTEDLKKSLDKHQNLGSSSPVEQFYER